MERKEFFYGLDVGSTTVKIAVLDSNFHVIFQDRTRTSGRPLDATLKLIKALERDIFPQKGARLAVTGTGGKLVGEILGGFFVNEIIAHTTAAVHQYPHARTLLDMGGQDTKLVLLRPDNRGKVRVEDFSLNTLCAAGTGAFLDQQAARLGLSIEEFSKIALQSRSPATLAGRCTVFAKSDMIHLQQTAVPDRDIVAGLCLALVRNLKATLARGKEILAPMIFQGGVAENQGVRLALRKVFGLKRDELLIPDNFRTMGAIGAVLNACEQGKMEPVFKGIEALERFIEDRPVKVKRRRPLRSAAEKVKQTSSSGEKTLPQVRKTDSGIRGKILIGIDVGSISTKMVATDLDGNILSSYYGKTAGRPIDALKTGLKHLESKVSGPYEVIAVGTTGSGRYLAADFVGADTCVNEITAQAKAAMALDKEVDTIFEIGGQDSKYIRINRGSVVDFMMNRACAAGTGSFLEEQADRLGIRIEDFGPLALSAKRPVKMGERCTVFMESDLVHYLQQGVDIPDLTAGLCYSIAYNFLNKVVEGRYIGRKVFFQGATALNQGIVAAFETILGRSITVPPFCNLTGALGAALIARERCKGKSSFSGFEVSLIPYEIKSFGCRACSNRCTISRLKVKGRRHVFYGGRCDRFETDTQKKHDSRFPDLVALRQERLRTYCREVGQDVEESPRGPIGIPYCLVLQEWLPFLAVFLKELGFSPVISPPTNRQIIKKGVEHVVNEPCFPVKTAHGHVLSLLEAGIKRIFLPSFIDFPGPEGMRPGQSCPYVQSLPYTVQAVVDFERFHATLLTAPLRLSRERGEDTATVLRLSKLLKVSPWSVKKALRAAWKEQEDFYAQSVRLGLEAINGLKTGNRVVLLVGRPYNALDPGANMEIHKKLLKLGVLPVPLDHLDLERYISKVPSATSMYWRYGQRILAAAAMVSEDPLMRAVYITNFGCGPDSFLLHRFQEIMGDRPFLELEIDEHTADAGVLTRLEAFLDTSSASKKSVKSPRVSPPRINTRPEKDRTIYIPAMSDHVEAVAAAMRACGVKAEVLPPTDDESVALGLKHTSGKECYPAILTTGDLVKMTRLPGFSPERAAFFMPCGQGPCRFGQYPSLHRKVLDSLGFKDVPIVSFNQDIMLYSELSSIGKDFARIAWQGIVAVDLLDRLKRQFRPYAEDRSEIDRLYRLGLELIVEGVSRKEDLVPALRKIRAMFDDLNINMEKRLPAIGIVGEIYTRANPQANANLVDELERLGARVLLPSMSEWILYNNYMAIRRARRNSSWAEFARLNLENVVQIRDLRRLEAAIGPVSDGKESLIRDILRLARPFVTDEFEGEAILSVGKAVEFIRHGVSGIINVMPLACMPGTIVNALLKRVREEIGNRPFLPLPCDGQQETLRALRLEAFVHQARLLCAR